MTKLEFLQSSLKRIAAANLTNDEAAIACTLSRFNNYLTDQLKREMGSGFKMAALSSLGHKGLVKGTKIKVRGRFRYALTPAGVELMQSILGKETQPS